jgi:4a-hydroxytetrahydrobiopterin dehydratase
VRLITITDDYYGMSTRDVQLARQISATARELGLSGNPLAAQTLLVTPGCADARRGHAVPASRARVRASR